jgi:hypothetical protein
MHARVAIRGRADDDVVLRDAEAPGVVIARAHELELRSVRLEAKDALAKTQFLAADRALESEYPTVPQIQPSKP